MFLEFDYDSIDGRIFTIESETDGHNIYFKCYEGSNKISKGLLSKIDIDNIEDFIRQHSEPEIEFESDFFERQND